MDLKYLSSNNWQEFEKQHSRAYHFLLHQSLLNEREHLRTNEYILNDWQKNRLAELEDLLK